MLSEAAAIDAREDVEGDRRGDELPAELCNRRSRRERLRRCKEELEAQEAEQQASDAEKLAWRAAWEAEHGRKLAGRKPTPPAPEALAKRRVNTADPDTRLLKRAGGRSVQGYNAQVVASPEQVIFAADITQQSNDSGQLAPMVRSARQALRAAGIEESVATVLADGGYWNSPQISDTKFIRRADRFLRRGLAACQAEWRLIAATHNLLKVWRAALVRT